MSAPANPIGCPSTDLDPWADRTIGDPYPFYRTLRDLGPVVWLARYGVAALPRFDEVRAALSGWQQFSSAHGNAMDATVNGLLPPNVLMSDPPLHERLRHDLAAQLSVGALRPDEPLVRRAAEELVDTLVARRAIDGVADLAQPFSLHVVGDLVGLPHEGRDALPHLAARAFNVFGPAGDMLDESFAALHELGEHARTVAEHGLLAPGSRGAQLVEAGHPHEMLVNYTWPGIDTTVNGVSAALLLFAQHPDQWQRVREDRSLIASAFIEALRVHTPVHFFTRLVTEDVEVGGVVLPAGVRVVLMYGSANRDERRYADPDRFDVTRNPLDHLSFGRGIHLCLGIHLAKLEGHAMLSALADRVERFEVTGEPEWVVNHTLHGLGRLPLELVPA